MIELCFCWCESVTTVYMGTSAQEARIAARAVRSSIDGLVLRGFLPYASNRWAIYRDGNYLGGDLDRLTADLLLGEESDS